MARKFIGVFVLTSAMLLVLYDLSTPWRERYVLETFVAESLPLGISEDEAFATLVRNKYEYRINADLKPPNLSGNEWTSAWKSNRSLIFGEYYLRINLYFDKKSRHLIERDTLVSYRETF